MRVKKGVKEIRNLFDLNGKVALVTGGSGALGKAVSIGLAAYGVDVVVCSLEMPLLEEVSDEIRDMGRKALPILSDEESYRSYVARIPIGRAAEPEDFVGVTIFLASDASEMVTGHVLSVDGGTVGG